MKIDCLATVPVQSVSMHDKCWAIASSTMQYLITSTVLTQSDLKSTSLYSSTIVTCLISTINSKKTSVPTVAARLLGWPRCDDPLSRRLGPPKTEEGVLQYTLCRQIPISQVCWEVSTTYWVSTTWLINNDRLALGIIRQHPWQGNAVMRRSNVFHLRLAKRKYQVYIYTFSGTLYIARLAQWIEHCFPKARVLGSSPKSGFAWYQEFLFAFAVGYFGSGWWESTLVITILTWPQACYEWMRDSVTSGYRLMPWCIIWWESTTALVNFRFWREFQGR